MWNTEVHWRTLVAGVDVFSLDYSRSLSLISRDFVFRRSIQLLSPVGSTEYLKASIEIFSLSSDMYLTRMYRKGAVPPGLEMLRTNSCCKSIQSTS